MIGQTKLKAKFSKAGKLPGFMVFSAPKGFGKKTLAKQLCDERDLNFVLVGNRAADIASLVSNANSTRGNMFYVDNGEMLTGNAENALLKTAEELPNGNTIVIGAEDYSMLLPTIVSRAQVVCFEPYEEEDFREYLGKHYVCSLPYSKIYPSIWHLQLVTVEDASFLWETCRTVSRLQIRDYKSAFLTKKLLSAYRLDQLFFALQNALDISIRYYLKMQDTQSIGRCYKILESVVAAKRLLASICFNREYILDKLFVDIVEASAC